MTDSMESLPTVVVDTVVVEVPVPQAPIMTRKTEPQSSTSIKTKSVESTLADKVAEEVAPAVQEAKRETENTVAEPTVEVSQTKKAHVPTAAEQAEENYNRQFKKAKRMFDMGNYKDALSIFTTLKYEKPSDAALDAYISECRKRM